MNIKNQFPLLINNPELAYLDNGATTQKPSSVIERVTKYYSEENANVHRGIYKLSEKSTEEYENARETVKSFINANSTKEIIFTSGTTDSINLVGYSWIWKNVFKGDTLLSTEMEHHSNIIQWQQAAKHKEGVNFELVKVTDNYELDLDDLKTKLEKFKPKLLALTHVSNVLGTINPIEEIVRIKNEVSPDTKILLDAAQSIPHMQVDVQKLGIDFMAFSGHKMYGPTGIGVLWAKEEILDKQMAPFRYGGGMITEVTKDDSKWAELPEKFEGGTPNMAGAVGLAEAIRFIEEIGWENIENHERELTKYTFEELSEIEEVTIFGPTDLSKRHGVFSIGINKIHPHDIAQILDEHNVAVRAGHHCCQILMKEVLRVPATTRISLGVYNTEEDVDRLVVGLKRVIEVFR